ncbi:MAG: AAA family ATPase [Candidatus Hydrogenedentes bacterium]|nr:AAA family ATPase [Candidatus Hydrogenedentota bacterium]
MRKVDTLTIRGFKSLRNIVDFPLRELNVLIGANGTGKSNLVSYFRMLGELVEGRLQLWTRNQGSADRILSFGVKSTLQLESSIDFGRNGYRFVLEPTVEGGFSFASESLFYRGDYRNSNPFLGSGQAESRLKESVLSIGNESIHGYCYQSISGWKVYHFHDTSTTAGVKRPGAVHDNQSLRTDASNLAAFLYRLRTEYPESYAQVRKTVQLAIPFFDDFDLRPQRLESGEDQIALLWRQKDSDYPFWPSQLSDGSLRFICLTAALLQPDPPSTIIIDEPELGLHPFAITLLGSLLRSASKRMQVIVSTQSVPLVNEFAPEDLVIVERENDATVFNRLEGTELDAWLEKYSLGELWEKNVLGGRPGQWFGCM